MRKKLSETARANREVALANGMGCATEWLDALRDGGFSQASIAYIDNGEGWAMGKRDASPVVDWTLIERIKRWNDRVFGRAVQIEQSKRCNMTDAQLACLRGDA